MRDRRRIKGLVVDEYADRIIVSTGDGEKTLMKSDVQSVLYSSEEDSLMRKAFGYLDRGRPVEAYNMFGNVLEISPDNDRARDMRIYIRGSMESAIRENFSGTMLREKAGHAGIRSTGAGSQAGKTLGFHLEKGEKNVIVRDVKKDLALYSAGDLEPGDRIVKVGGIFTAFMDPEEVYGLLLAKTEVNLTLERTVFPEIPYRRGILGGLFSGRYRNMLGAALKLYRQGITVEDLVRGGTFCLAGIREGDLVWSIDGKSTRYMPVSEAVDVISRNRGRTIEIVVRRNMTLWRKAN